MEEELVSIHIFYSENVINPTGCIWASAGYNVHLRDPSPEQLTAGIAYIEQEVSAYATKTGRSPGKAQPFMSLEDAVETAWLVIEAVPEKLPLKISTFAELSACAPTDCILASNSSSYKSSEMLDKVPEEVKPRILNMHYYMPPKCMIVELMTDGFTSDEIFPFMVERCREGATSPYVARKESTGFIFNRLWAAVKREVLTILSEGVSVPEEIDAMWETMFIEGRSLPCKMMDREYCLIPVPPDVLYLLISKKRGRSRHRRLHRTTLCARTRTVPRKDRRLPNDKLHRPGQARKQIHKGRSVPSNRARNKRTPDSRPRRRTCGTNSYHICRNPSGPDPLLHPGWKTALCPS